jgi:hypothetical protein
MLQPLERLVEAISRATQAVCSRRPNRPPAVF